MSLYVGIDPSFSATGMCVMDLDNRTINFYKLSPPGTNGNYQETLNRSAILSLLIFKSLQDDRDTRVMIEEPLLTSMKSSSLGILSTFIVLTLSFVHNITHIWSVNPNYVSSVNRPIAKRQGLDRKKASSYVAHQFLDYLVEEEGYEIVVMNDKYNKDGSMKARKMSHDESESFIILLQLLLKDNVLSTKAQAELSKINKKFITTDYKLSHIKGENINGNR